MKCAEWLLFFCSLPAMSLQNSPPQLQNYQRKMEQKMQREEDLRTGLKLYKSVN